MRTDAITVDFPPRQMPEAEYQSLVCCAFPGMAFFNFAGIGEDEMDNRLTMLNIIISDREAAVKVNELLHTYSQYVIGRMGLPYGQRGVSIICVVLDMPSAEASALSGKLGMIPSVTAKMMTPKI